MNNIVLDFRQNYVRGERLESQEIAYQYDEGRILEAYVPETETDFFVHVGFENDPKLSVITVDSVEAAETGGGYKILADIPSSIMTRYGTMLVYIIAADANDMIVTTYEGEVPIRHKGVAEDYVVPDEEATSIIERADAARAAAVVAQTAAETAAQSAEASAEQAMSGTPEGYANLVGSMAPAYSTASTYAVGDHVLHDSKLYVCNTAITTAEAWTAAHWTAVTAGGELSQLKSHFYDSLPADTASGAIASFPDGANDIPLVDMTVQIEPVQSGSGDPSPSNVRPITGWTGANIHNFGLPEGYTAVDYVTLSAPVRYDGITDYNRDDLVINTEFKIESISNYGVVYSAYTGEAYNATRCIINGSYSTGILINNNSKASAPKPVATNYYISGAFNDLLSYHGGITINSRAVSGAIDTTPGTANTATSMILNGSGHSTSFRRFDIRTSTSSGRITLASLIPCTNPQDVAGFWDIIGKKFYTTDDPSNITATGTPHRGTEHLGDEPVIAISWQSEAGTVYGGTLDVTSGVLTVTDANIASYNGETLPSTWISDRDVYAEGTTPTTGAQVVYKLAESQTYQLTPTEVKTLLGQNHIWADTGNVSLEYRADTKLYIDKKLSELS